MIPADKAQSLAQKWRAEAENFNIRFRNQDPYGTQITVAALEGCATELEDLCRSSLKKDTESYNAS